MLLKSVVDGFNVIVGSYNTHFAALLSTLAPAVWKSDLWDDEERGTRTKWLFGFLLIYHVSLGLLKLLQTWEYRSI